MACNLKHLTAIFLSGNMFGIELTMLIFYTEFLPDRHRHSLEVPFFNYLARYEHGSTAFTCHILSF